MISIIIPAFNEHEMTAECITALRECGGVDEIILIDNGSDPPFTKPYTGFIDCQLLRNEENLGFPKAVNQGIAAAKNPIVVLLNNDVIVTPGWAEKLALSLGYYSIVGPVTNYSAGKQRVSLPVYENTQELNEAAKERAEQYGDRVEEVRWVIGYCMAFWRSLWEEIGPFDESLWPCCGEEIDFCLRARDAGYRIGIVLGCFVHHEGSRTFQAMGLDYPEIIERNEEHLRKRWGANFWGRQSIEASAEPRGLSLNLGCGWRKLEGFVNVDCRAEVEPDLVCDLLDGLPYPDSSVDVVRADDFLEHIPIGQTIQAVTEIWRVLKPGGVFESSTPSTDGRGAFQDPTHLSFWNRNSWLYYSDKASRELYGIKADFQIESITENEPDPALMIIHTHVIAKAVK